MRLLPVRPLQQHVPEPDPVRLRLVVHLLGLRVVGGLVCRFLGPVVRSRPVVHPRPVVGRGVPVRIPRPGTPGEADSDAGRGEDRSARGHTNIVRGRGHKSRVGRTIYVPANVSDPMADDPDDSEATDDIGDRDPSPVSRRRVLGGSASLATLAALAGCLDDEEIDELLDETDDDGGDDDRRRDEEGADDSADDADDDPDPEPDDPPETVADGFDIDAALAATVDAIETEPFTVGGTQNEFDDTNGGTLDDSIAYTSVGDPDPPVGRFRFAGGDVREIDYRELDGEGPAVPEEAGETGDLLFRDESVTVREVFEGEEEPRYGRDEEADYAEFTDQSAIPIEQYHEAGVQYGFEFDEPRWDDSAGVYVVEGTDAETDNIEAIDACRLEIDRDGAVVGLEVDVEWSRGGHLRTEGEGAYRDPVSVPEPDWLDEAEDRIDEPDEPDDDVEEPDDRDVVDATGQSTVTIRVGAGDDGLAFDPDHVIIDAGTLVVWEWTGRGGAHNVVSLDGEFESDITDAAGHTFDHRFTDPGVYEYVCEPHQAVGMGGRIDVE